MTWLRPRRRRCPSLNHAKQAPRREPISGYASEARRDKEGAKANLDECVYTEFDQVIYKNLSNHHRHHRGMQG